MRRDRYYRGNYKESVTSGEWLNFKKRVREERRTLREGFINLPTMEVEKGQRLVYSGRL